MVSARQVLTLDEFLRLPEKKPALEYEDGRITQKVSPKGKHGTLQPAIWYHLNGFGRPRGIGVAFTELRTTFAGRSYVPDVTFFRLARIPVDPNDEVADEFFLPADISVEIVSPKQSVRTLIERCEWYVANGVEIAVLVNDRDRTVRVFRADRPMQLLQGLARINLDDVLPGFELTADQLFAALKIR